MLVVLWHRLEAFITKLSIPLASFRYAAWIAVFVFMQKAVNLHELRMPALIQRCSTTYQTG